ncbi:MAG: sulfurtransferase [Acidobacteriota bacterium]|nr:sulfurtransferase [Acidobacteriota bacterium]
MSGIPESIVSAAWLRGRLAARDSRLVVVDVRSDLNDPDWGGARYLEGHLPGAVFADTDRDLSAPKTGTNGRHPLPTVERMAEVFGRLGIGPDSVVVAYDHASGLFAARLWWMLRHLGHAEAAVLDGGMDAWEVAGGSLVPGEETRAPRRFVPRPEAGMAIGLAEVEAGLASRAHVLVDAREPVRWRGEHEPIDPVAGRIPGARNHLWKESLGPDGRFRSPEDLRARLGGLTADRAGRRVVCYCGSGLSAAHNALALELAGIEDVAVYSGSWSEWCADPRRPVERGTP